ncbi:MAG: IS4 family transposase [Chromatiaceae bacterium]
MNWAADELRWLRLPDLRLVRRVQRVVELLAEKPTASVPVACGNWADTKATYRLWSSARVSAKAIQDAHVKRTVERASQGDDVILAIQDTTQLDFTTHPGTTGLGPIGRSFVRGLMVHTTMAASAEGVPLGMLDQQVWARPEPEEGQISHRRQRATADKESQVWLNGLASAQQVVAPGQRMVVVADRGADIYDLFTAPRREGVDLLIRAEYNRRILEEDGHVWDAVRAAQVGGQATVAVSRIKGRLQRDAAVTYRWESVTVRPPHRGTRPDSSTVKLTAVLVEEEQPPEGVAPICWRLLTTLPVTTFEVAQRVVRWYTLRWLIERYHYVLKSGCGIEDLQLEDSERLTRALATYSIVAWRLLWLTHLARETPEAPCTSALSTSEWQALHCTIHRTPTPPDHPPSLRQAIRWIAQLGGFLGRKGDGEAGVKSIWRGLQRLNDITATWVLLHPAPGPPPAGQSYG